MVCTIHKPRDFVDRRGRQGGCTVACLAVYSGWCACSQTEVKRSREDGEGWLEWDKHAASSAIAVTRAVKGTQWWQRKSLVHTAVQVEQCNDLTVSSWNCGYDTPHFHTCTPTMMHMQSLFMSTLIDPCQLYSPLLLATLFFLQMAVQ